LGLGLALPVPGVLGENTFIATKKEMTVRKQFLIKESADLIIQKTHRLRAISLIAQEGDVEGLSKPDIEALFSVFVDVTTEILDIAKSIPHPTSS